MFRSHSQAFAFSCSLVDSFAMPRGFTKAPNAAKVAAKRPQADLRQHFVTSKQRPNVTKDMSFCWGDLDVKSFEHFSQSLTSDTAVSLASPAFGISQHMQLFGHCRDELLPYVDNGILGSGVRRFVDMLHKQHEIFNVLDSFHELSGGRDEGNIRDALNKADRLFGKLSTRDDWKDVCVGMRAAGVRLMHFAQAFQECIHYFGENPAKVAKSIPPNQACSDRLREAAASSEQSLNAKGRLLSWTAKALVHKNSEFASHGPSTVARGRDFSNLTLDDDGDAPREPSPNVSEPDVSRSRSPRRRSTTPRRQAKSKAKGKAKARSIRSPIVSPVRSRSVTPPAIPDNTAQRAKGRAKARGRSPIGSPARSISPLRSVTPPAASARDTRQSKTAAPDPNEAILKLLTGLADRISTIEQRSSRSRDDNADDVQDQRRSSRSKDDIVLDVQDPPMTQDVSHLTQANLEDSADPMASQADWGEEQVKSKKDKKDKRDKKNRS